MAERKTLALVARIAPVPEHPAPPPHRQEQKFFASFFQKEGLASLRYPSVAALAFILLVTGALWRGQPVRSLNAFDQPFYLGIADDLVQHQRFTDGFMFAKPDASGLRSSGMRFAPLYPALIAAAASLDGRLRAGMDCVVAGADQDPACPHAAPLMRWVQFGELAGFFWLLWWMARRTGGAGVGWVALGLALFTAPLLMRSVNYLMTEMTTLVLSAAAMAAGLEAVAQAGRRRLAWAAGAGALLALAALTRPAFLYLVPAALFAVAALGRRRAWPALAAMAGAAGLTIAPWVVRNAVVLGRPALTYGYDSHTLVQRIAFDAMTWREYRQSFVCWLPDGTSLGRRWFPPTGCDRFGWDDHPTSFYALGLNHLLPETLAAAGGYDHHLGYLLTHYILRMPVWHAMVSIPLALRGAYVAHWWGFVLFWAALGLTWAARPWRAQNEGSMWRPGVLLLAWPAWFMLAFNASVAVNQVRYNLLLIPLYAVAGAWLVVAGVARLRRRTIAP